MGLDIHAWAHVRKIPACPTCGRTAHDESSNDLRVSSHPATFPERAAPFESGDVLRASDEQDHISFGYGGWSHFRSLLCEAANGVPCDREDRGFWERHEHERGDAVLWDLINFTDCDGLLGPIACERIHRELVATRDAFHALVARDEHRADARLAVRYDALIAVFRVASAGGLVRFG